MPKVTGEIRISNGSKSTTIRISEETVLSFESRKFVRKLGRQIRQAVK